MVSGTAISHCHKVGHELSHALIGAMAATDDFACAQALGAHAAHRLAIIVEELVTNLIDHAVHGRDITFSLSFDAADGSPMVVLEDDSDPFDPRAVPLAQMPNPVRGGGVGLTLVTAWTDIVSYDYASGRNRLVLQLRVAG